MPTLSSSRRQASSVGMSGGPLQGVSLPYQRPPEPVFIIDDVPNGRHASPALLSKLAATLPRPESAAGPIDFVHASVAFERQLLGLVPSTSSCTSHLRSLSTQLSRSWSRFLA